MDTNSLDTLYHAMQTHTPEITISGSGLPAFYLLTTNYAQGQKKAPSFFGSFLKFGQTDAQKANGSPFSLPFDPKTIAIRYADEVTLTDQNLQQALYYLTNSNELHEIVSLSADYKIKFDGEKFMLTLKQSATRSA